MDAPGWRQLARRIEEAGVGFVSPPRVLEPGSPHERGKFLLQDPAGNLLEFKCRRSAAG